MEIEKDSNFNQPCGEKPIEPPMWNNSQYKSSKSYKKFQNALQEWNDCMGIE